MPKGVYAAASAMVVEARSLDVVARNLAHVSTAGYRKESALRTDFAKALAKEGRTGDLRGDGGAGILTNDSYFSFGEGQKERTGAPLDVAITGDGFFRVRDDQNKLLLTRAGNFTTDAQGRMLTAEGWTVEGQGGPIVIPPEVERIAIDQQGRVTGETHQGGITTTVTIDQLRLATVAEPSRMRPRNGQYFDPAGQELRDATKASTQQGYVEHANVDPVHELVEMITIQRRYDAAQKAMRTQDQAGQGLSDMLRGA